MAIPSNRVPESKLFASLGQEASSASPVKQSSAAARPDKDATLPSRHVLPQDLNTAIKQLPDQELDRLVTAVLEERARRKKPPLPGVTQRKRDAEAVSVSLPQGKLNAVRAAFKAGVTPARIAREFGISQTDVRRALAGDATRKR